MNIYEIVNPSDAITFMAPDDAVARAAVLVLGNGAYGLHDVTDGQERDVPCLLLFCSKEQTEKFLVKWFGEESLAGFLGKRWPEVRDALRTAQNVGADARVDYESAIARMTPESAEKHRREVEDRHRTSLNEIVKRAWHIAEHAKDPGEAVR